MGLSDEIGVNSSLPLRVLERKIKTYFIHGLVCQSVACLARVLRELAEKAGTSVPRRGGGGGVLRISSDSGDISNGGKSKNPKKSLGL